MDFDFYSILNESSPILVAIVIVFAVWGLKKTPSFPDWLLPFASMAMGAALYPMLEGWSQKTLIQGMAVGGLAVTFNQQFRQFLRRFGANGETEVIEKTKP